jgi:hypothetical protein
MSDGRQHKNLAGRIAGGRKGAKRSPWRGSHLNTENSRKTAWRKDS